VNIKLRSLPNWRISFSLFYCVHIKGNLQWWLRRWRCEDCGVWWKNKVVHAMTQYHYEGPPNVHRDPNRDLHLCPDCKEQYEQHWSDMWAEYHAGLL